MATVTRTEARVNIVNKSASIATVTYTNWDDNTSRSVVIPAGSSFLTRNWHEPNELSIETTISENTFNLPIEDYNPSAAPLTKVLLQDFAFDKERVSVTITYDPQV
jgi:hypothetical protein